MATNMFLKLDGIPGESLNDVHKNEIELIEWGHGLTQTGHAAVNSGITNGKVSIADLHFSKVVDSATVNILQFCCSATPIKNVKVSVMKQFKEGDKSVQKDYFVIEFTNCIVSSYHTSGSEADTGQLVEHVTINFATVKWTYTTQLKDATSGPKASTGWNVNTNTPVT